LRRPLARWLAWGVLLLLGVTLLGGAIGRLPSRRVSAVALALSVAAVLLGPWPFARWIAPCKAFWDRSLETLSAVLPYRVGLFLLVLGLALNILVASLRFSVNFPSIPRADARLGPERFGRRFLDWLILDWLMRLPQRICTALVAAGCLLLAQSLAILAYRSLTARSHELPWPLPQVIGAVAGVLGIDVAVHETTLTTHSMRAEHHLGATWELLVDPVTVCFVAGGIVLLCLRHWADRSPEKGTWHLLRSVVILLVLAAFWLPLRAGLLMAIFLHDVLRLDYDAPLWSMNVFWNPWIHLALLAGPILLAWRFLPGTAAGQSEPPPEARKTAAANWRLSLAAVLVAAGVAALTVGVLWDPVGRRLEGRVLVEEYHPEGPDKVWEPTFKPYDTEWYGQLAGYNYYCIYDYLSYFYRDISRSNKPLDDAALEACDVLVIKVPTRAYSADEIDAVGRFVEGGGGLLLIGEHTNVFGSGEYLNEIAREFGFAFRYDCLFGVDSVFDDRWTPPVVPHPIVQNMPAYMDFATSCSIAPGCTAGRAPMYGTGLKNLMADYHVENFYPEARNRADMRYGAFVQLWSMRYGRGRVVAFSDSTIFSNFSTFTPGKAELMLGMVEWLNHRNELGDPRWPLAFGGVVLLLGGLLAAWPPAATWPILLAAGLLGTAAAAAGVQTAHRCAMPLPEPVRPMVRVIIDRTLSEVTLPKNQFIAGGEDGFGIFERWILRLGYFTTRQKGLAALDGDLVVFICPTKAVDEGFREALEDYVARGGKVLVVDTAADSFLQPHSPLSSANDLLKPFGLSVDCSSARSGRLTVTGGLPSVDVQHACVVRGGQPLASLNGRPVASSLRHGKGTVTVVGFGSRFSDANMGYTGDVVPQDELEYLRDVFELEFSLLRKIIDDDGLTAP